MCCSGGNRPRLTSAQFLGTHRRALETVSDLYAAIEELPVLAAADPATMNRFFEELSEVQATALPVQNALCKESLTDSSKNAF
jgi:hypothetical protein